MRVKHSKKTREKVLALIKQGLTYRQIQNTYPVPKATISYWVTNAGLVRNSAIRYAHLPQARQKGLDAIKLKKLIRMEEAYSSAATCAREISLSNHFVQKGLLAMLYWAEGTKSDRGALIFVNTDPLLLKLYISLLRSAFEINESGVRVRLHLHNYHDQATSISYWATLLEVPKSQFGKIYVKKRSTQRKFRENFQGICTVVYHSSAVRRELMALGKILAERL